VEERQDQVDNVRSTQMQRYPEQHKHMTDQDVR